MIVGAGNAYVAAAKRELYGVVGIDLHAGPTELLIIADEAASPKLVAADLLGQAEHGPTSEVVLVTTSERLASEVVTHVEQFLQDGPTRDVAGVAWRDHGAVIVCDSPEEVAGSRRCGLGTRRGARRGSGLVCRPLTNYGSLFIGAEATVAFSDKAIGTNHVLPTGRAARYTGGLGSVRSSRALTYQRITEAEASRPLAEAVAAISAAEGLPAHGATATRRLARL